MGELVPIYYAQRFSEGVLPSLWVLLLNHLRRFISLLFNDGSHLVQTHDFRAAKHGPVFLVGKNMDVVEVAVGIIQAFLYELLFFGSRIIRAAVFDLTHLALFRIRSESRARIARQILSGGRDHRFVLIVHRA